MATSIATGALGPRVAVAISGVLNFSGLIYYRSRATKVDRHNVNSEWTGGVAPEKVPAETAAA